MLEIGIVITVALILFLLLRNFPKASEENGGKIMRENNFAARLWDKLMSKRRVKEEDDMKKALIGEQTEVVSPKDIEDAQESYHTENPEIAKLLHEAQKAWQDEEFRKVEECSIKALELDKRCDQAYVFIGRIMLYKKDFDNAREAATTAIKCNSENAEAYAIIGECFLFEEKYFDAIENYQKAVIIDRNQPSWHAGLGKAYLEVRQFSKAAKALRRASSLDIDNKEYKDLASQAEDKQKSHSQAIGRK